jgi:hypothetical protein
MRNQSENGAGPVVLAGPDIVEAKHDTSRYESYLLPQQLGESTEKNATPNDLKAAPEGIRWQPKYLRRRLLLLFTIIFIAIVIAVEALLTKSDRSQGLCDGNSPLAYLWMYGPSAILTLVAALWSRV